MSQDQPYHSGKRLRKLREFKGLKEIELSEALGTDFDSLRRWENEGVPKDQLAGILNYFKVPPTMFSAPVANEAELKTLAQQQLIGQTHDMISHSAPQLSKPLKPEPPEPTVEPTRLKKLVLHHIGIYDNLTIDFNEDLTVLIGVNGAGKTTILKAIALAILGHRTESNESALRHAARDLRKLDCAKTIASEISLSACINGQDHQNTIRISYDADSEEYHLAGTPFKALYSDDNLSQLILGLPEQRSSDKKPEPSEEHRPKNRDILPLVSADGLACPSRFSDWLKILETKKLQGDGDSEAAIDFCFRLFSAFMGETIEAAGLSNAQFDEMEPWIRYKDGSKVPLRLASQGYQAVMGWVGFIIQRMIEAYADIAEPFSQHAIVIIDEIDQLLSVKWQQKILAILRKEFPNTQWIITTHSPMVLTDLDQHQVRQLHERDGRIVADSNEVDLWMWQYGDIVRRFFEIPTTAPKYQEQALVNEIAELVQAADSSQKQSYLDTLQERLAKVRASKAAVDDLEAQLQSLARREQELVELMQQLKDGQA